MSAPSEQQEQQQGGDQQEEQQQQQQLLPQQNAAAPAQTGPEGGAPETAALEAPATTTAAATTEPSSDPDPPESPPLPSKHTAATPGPRAVRFHDVFSSTLKHTLDKISRVNFAACYPTIAARAPGTLEFVQRQMVDRLGAQCNKEFDSILENRNVVAKLNELESLVSDAARRKADGGGADATTPVPPHTLPATAVQAAHLAPHLASQQSQLNAKLQNVQAHNARLFEDIRQQRAELEALLAAVEAAVADMEGASGLLDGVVDELALESRDVEMQMSGV
ncbi:Nnf1-domain-containing protein [Podospora appendiculata]|uniref:Nnf1-domain-containing protein n=1 Tax=Podospora appendiculata TaxID=314037 RepID=A0AAE1CFY1_9PEZI|nr:Nnf1-domain-containing protein [Podospora appendiculata]